MDIDTSLFLSIFENIVFLIFFAMTIVAILKDSVALYNVSYWHNSMSKEYDQT